MQKENIDLTRIPTLALSEYWELQKRGNCLAIEQKRDHYSVQLTAIQKGLVYHITYSFESQVASVKKQEVNGHYRALAAERIASSPEEKAALAAYVEFTNNYLTHAKFAEHHFPHIFVSSETKAIRAAEIMVEIGREIWESVNAYLTP